MKVFFCKECGFETSNWSGKCPSCGQWNSLTEADRLIKKGKKTPILANPETIEAVQLSKINHEHSNERITTGLSEFDCTLGGGIVHGMVALIGGEPGIGKSTIMIQIADRFCIEGRIVLYVSGEESSEQIKLRADRLGIKTDNIYLFCHNEVEVILREIDRLKPDLVIIDSIQAVCVQQIDNLPGSVVQIKESANLLINTAKRNNVPIFLIGHVTKEGVVAGPKILEHMVDTVLYFEGELTNQFKILRTTKNRFGSTNEIGIFEMTDKGLIQVENPSELFIANQKQYPGTAIGCVMEGSRAFLMEVQALVSLSNYGNAQRVSVGLDHKRLALLLAVIEKNMYLNMKEYDIFINFTGGIKVMETSADLSIITAILSSFKDVEVPAKTVFIGEVGLNGDIRSVSNMGKRINEAMKLGYKRIITAKNPKSKTENKHIITIEHIRELVKYISVEV